MLGSYITVRMLSALEQHSLVFHRRISSQVLRFFPVNHAAKCFLTYQVGMPESATRQRV